MLSVTTLEQEILYVKLSSILLHPFDQCSEILRSREEFLPLQHTALAVLRAKARELKEDVGQVYINRLKLSPTYWSDLGF